MATHRAFSSYSTSDSVCTVLISVERYYSPQASCAQLAGFDSCTAALYYSSPKRTVCSRLCLPVRFMCELHEHC